MSRLDELLLLWQDQSLTEDELSKLKRLLASPEGRARAAEDFLLTGVVLESLQTQRAAQQLFANPVEEADVHPARTKPLSRLQLRLWLLVAAVLLLTLGAALWFWPSPPPTPAPPFAQLEQVQGDTFVVSNQAKSPAQAGQVLQSGQGITTEGADSEAVVQMKDAVRLTLGGDTTVIASANTEEPNAGGPKVVLEQGDLLVEVTRALRKRKTTVQTPLGIAVTETEETALHVSDAAGVVVVRGEILFIHKASGKSLRLKANQYLAVELAGDPYPARLFSGTGTVWTTFPPSGLDTNSLGGQVSFSRDGKRLAAAGRTGEGGIRLGSPDEPPPPVQLRGERCVAFCPQGTLLATANLGNVLLHDVAGGKPPRVLMVKDRRPRVVCLAFSPDGKSLAVGRAGSKEPVAVEIWDVATGELRTSWPGHSAGITCVAFAPDGKLLATGSLDKSVILWDMVSGQEHARISGTDSLVVWGLAFAPDGKTLAIAAGTSDFRVRQGGSVRLWGLETGKVWTTLHGHTRAVTSVIFSADGQSLISGSADTTIRFWNPVSGREDGMLKPHKAAPGFETLMMALSPEGALLATTSFDRTVKLWKITGIREQSPASARLTVPSPPQQELPPHLQRGEAQPGSSAESLLPFALARNKRN